VKRREFLCSAAVAGTGLMLSGGVFAAAAEGTPARVPLIGMYVHQHWPYNHPYAARTWTVEDWRGYLDGLHRLGYNMVQIWPMLVTMPNPPTPAAVAEEEALPGVVRAVEPTAVFETGADNSETPPCLCME